ncbi:MAG: PQQ-binding-like beta-propeller repeat protein [Acidimicrobiales bacterium]
MALLVGATMVVAVATGRSHEATVAPVPQPGPTTTIDVSRRSGSGTTPPTLSSERPPPTFGSALVEGNRRQAAFGGTVLDWPTVALTEDLVLVVGEAGIIALDRATLAERWYLPCDEARLPDGFARTAGTAALVQCDGTGSLRGIDLATGDVIWTEQAYFSYDGLRASNEAYAWLSDNKVIVADTSTGERLWTAPVSVLRGKRPLGVDDERVYLSAGGMLGAYNATNGTPVWEVDLPSVEARSDDGQLFAIAGDELVRLDAATGGEVWRTSLLDDRPVEGEILAITPQSVVVEGAPKQIVVVDRSSGAVRWRERHAELIAVGAGAVALWVDGMDDDGEDDGLVNGVYDELTGALVQTVPWAPMAIDGDEAAWLELETADIESAVTLHVALCSPDGSVCHTRPVGRAQDRASAAVGLAPPPSSCWCSVASSCSPSSPVRRTRTPHGAPARGPPRRPSLGARP